MRKTWSGVVAEGTSLGSDLRQDLSMDWVWGMGREGKETRVGPMVSSGRRCQHGRRWQHGLKVGKRRVQQVWCGDQECWHVKLEKLSK